MDFPHLIFTVSLIGLWLVAEIGALLRRKLRILQEDERQDFTLVLGATLTLLGLIIGFSFSMVITRYDQRKNYEEDEANAIGTEFVRADLLPAEDKVKIREMLKLYLEQRVLFYEARDAQQLTRINSATAHLQVGLWSAVQAATLKQPTCTVALAASGMNDVLNSQGYTQAAWWNRLPMGAWLFLLVIAALCNFLIGYSSHRNDLVVLMILPLAVSISFFLIADIDSPRRGLIQVVPQNLLSLSQSLVGYSGFLRPLPPSLPQ